MNAVDFIQDVVDIRTIQLNNDLQNEMISYDGLIKKPIYGMVGRAPRKEKMGQKESYGPFFSDNI